MFLVYTYSITKNAPKAFYSLVGMTRFELATSRPPAVRATNCATPRQYIKSPSIVSA